MKTFTMRCPHNVALGRRSSEVGTCDTVLVIRTLKLMIGFVQHGQFLAVNPSPGLQRLTSVDYPTPYLAFKKPSSRRLVRLLSVLRSTHSP